MITFRRRISTMIVIATIFAIHATDTGVSRSINISSSWLLPQNEFPVFYRHFKDKVTWFEADAVCQFHHAQLATVESNSQFEAIRSYLKELDVTENVWIGLKRNSEASEFTWTNYQPLARSGYFREEVPRSLDPVCVVIDPTVNFKWHSLHCGGPEVASFVCELPVPYWASKSNGCMTNMMEDMTVTFLPERPAIQLTKECSPGVFKNVTCRGNMKQSEIIEQLSCPNTNKLLKTLIKPIKPILEDVNLRTTTSSSESDVEDYAIEMATIAQYNDETIQSISKVMGRGIDGLINLPQEMSIAQEPIKLSGRGLFDTNGIDSAFIGGAAEIAASTTTRAPPVTTSTTTTTTTTSIPSTTTTTTTTTTSVPSTTTTSIPVTTTSIPRTTTTSIPKTTTTSIPSTTSNVPSTTTSIPSTTTNIPSTITTSIPTTTTTTAGRTTTGSTTTGKITTDSTATRSEFKQTGLDVDAIDSVTAANRIVPRTVANNVKVIASTSATTTNTGKPTTFHVTTEKPPTTSSSTVIRMSTSTGQPSATIALNSPSTTAAVNTSTTSSGDRTTYTTTVSSGGHHHHHHHHSSTTAKSPITAKTLTTEKVIVSTTAKNPTAMPVTIPFTSTVKIPYTMATKGTTQMPQVIRVYKKTELPPMATESDFDDFPYKPVNYTGAVRKPSETATSTAAATRSAMNSTTPATSSVKTSKVAVTTIRATTVAFTSTAAEPASPSNDTSATATGASGTYDDSSWDPTPSSSPPTAAADTAAVATDSTTAINPYPPSPSPSTAAPQSSSPLSTSSSTASHRKANNYDAYTDHPNRNRHIIRPKQHHHSYPYILYRLLG